MGAAHDKFRDAVAASEVAYVEITQGAKEAVLEDAKSDETKKMRNHQKKRRRQKTKYSEGMVFFR